MERLLSLEDIENLPDGTLVGFLTIHIFYGDEIFGVINHADGIQVIDFPEDCEEANVDNFLLPYLEKNGVEIVDGKVKAKLYKEI